jgi:predicted AlkP superfamily phosphohydrolase/phosphomutase
MSADHIHHVAWPDWEERGVESVVADVYRILDEATGALAELGGGQRDVMLVSDHGGGSLEGVVDLNAWLASQGLLTWAGGSAASRGELGRRAVNTAYRAQRALPAAVRDRLKRLAPGVRDRALELREVSSVDWSQTRAFAYGAFGNVVVNLRGREEHGIVAPGAEYEAVRDEIIEALLQLESPEGRRIVGAVHRRESLFSGPALESVPDLVVEFADYAWLGTAPLDEARSSIWTEIRVGPGGSARYVGSHRHEGIVVLSGPSCRAGVQLQASIEDVCPTILQLLGAPLPPDLEGRPLLEGLEGEQEITVGAAVAIAPDHETTGYDDAGAAEVEERLRGLGYLE